MQKAQPKGTHKKSKCSQSSVEEPNKAKTVCEGPRTKKVQEVTTDTAVEPNVKKDGPNNKTYRRKVLNRSEKTSVIHHAGGTHNTTLFMLAMMRVCSQFPLPSEDLKNFCDFLPVSTIEFLTEHLKRRFVTLYEEGAAISAASDGYLQFQLKWHHYCSYFKLFSC